MKNKYIKYKTNITNEKSKNELIRIKIKRQFQKLPSKNCLESKLASY